MSVNTKITPVLSEFVTDMALLPFTHGMSGPTWVTARGFVGALDVFLSRRVSPEIGTVRAENKSVFPSDHYPVRLCLHTLPALVPPGNPTSTARFRLGTGVSGRPSQLAVLAPFSSLDCHVGVISLFCHCPNHGCRDGFRTTKYPDTVPGVVSTTARVLHALLKAHRRWWLTAPLVRKVVAARKAIRQAWEVAWLERSLEIVPLAPPGGVKGPTKSDYHRLL